MAAPTYDELVALVDSLRASVARLEADNARLQAELEAARRAGKRQAAPFRKGLPKSDPQTPGRKSGDVHGLHGHRPPPSPGQIQETHEAVLPAACPHCGGGVAETSHVEQFQTDIPRRPIVRCFRIPVGHCQRCGKRVQGRHPLQTSDAVGAAASQLGPEAQAAAVLLNKQAGLSHGKVAACFQALFGITVTRGASAQIGLRAATRLGPVHQAILQDLRESEQLKVDETGWRIGGHPAWLHAWVGDRATGYAIDPQRSAAVLEPVIGRDWDGVLVHDGFASYDRFAEAIHQQCVAHVLRRAHELLAVAARGAVHFPRHVIALFTAAIHLKNQYHAGAVPVETVWAARDAFDERLLDLAARPRVVPAYQTLAEHLWRHAESWFSFLTAPSIPATNWPAEQAIRPAVVNRKVWGGNRTAAGAAAQGVLLSVIETCRRQTRSALDFVSETLRAFGNRLLSPPVLLLSR
ncbi:MAG TPA: IS66 family transposase [Planctomycetota bacterium]|nr:IS66 family transposase [Planctomycetota bacterium]